MARIAHFIQTRHSGGAERVVIDLGGALVRQGHEVDVLHFGNEWIAKHAPQAGFHAVQLSHRDWFVSKWSLAPFVAYLTGVLRRRGVELLHSHLNGSIFAGACASFFAGIPHVGTLHDVCHVQENRRNFRPLGMAARIGTRMVAVSEDMRAFYEQLAKGKIPIERIYNGVAMADAGVPRQQRAKAFTFVSVGRLMPVKGFDILLDALAATGTNGPHLRIAGEGRERSALEARMRERGLHKRVEFLGFQQDIAGVLAGADAFVLASRSEGLSCSIAEAMAAGLPCIVTDVGGNRELVIDGTTGFLVPSEDVTALAQRMRHLADDRERAQRLGEAARQRAEAHFSIPVMVKSYDELYRALL
ncbi:MAG: glycosyltransferase family 4 protein [Thiohalomonadaceae bacterium]